MDAFLKLTSTKADSNCNCITPFYLGNSQTANNFLSGINPNTGRNYSKEDIDALKTSLYRISNAKGCDVSVCCDPADPNTNLSSSFAKQFIAKYPLIMPIYEGQRLINIKLSTTKDVKTSGWQEPSPYMICKITKAIITDTDDNTIKLATNLVNDCFLDNCSTEVITVNNLLQNSKADMKYTYVDDARLAQSIKEGNISYVKEYIRKYKNLDIPLTHDDYNNRMIHIAASSKYTEILTMLIALKANINILNKLRETPIHFAITHKHIDNINALLTQGADLTIPNNNGETPMFYAMKTGDLRIVNMLYNSNSPIQGIDKKGNNLIHYCIMNCPSYSENDDTVPNSKGEIIQFLIDRGISTEHKNNDGITPLELTSKKIKKINEISAEATHANNTNANNTYDNYNITEHFFNNTNNKSTNSRKNTNTTRTQNNSATQQTNNNTTTIPKKGAVEQEINDYTPEHISLLDIQTKLFNNILRNNPTKYGDYINVDDIPKGAPIEILDTVCVGGNNITGNEDSTECTEKGGRLSYIKNKTTKIKLELVPESESAIDNLHKDELYYPKHQNKIPKGTAPNSVVNYNASLQNTQPSQQHNILPITPQTTSITYNIGENSTDVYESTTQTTNQPSQLPRQPPSQPPSQPPRQSITTQEQQKPISNHPDIMDEFNDIVINSRNDANNNSKLYTNNKNNKNNNTTAIEGFINIDNYNIGMIFDKKLLCNTKFRIALLIVLVIIFGIMHYM